MNNSDHYNYILNNFSIGEAFQLTTDIYSTNFSSSCLVGDVIEDTRTNPARVNFASSQNVQLISLTHTVSTNTENDLKYIVFL